MSFAAGPIAHADLHLEPFLGYLMGKDAESPKHDAKGIDLGARIGYRTLGFSVGGEYSMSDFTIEYSQDTSFEPHKLGAFVAYEFPILFRVYGTYIFSSEGDFGSAKLKDGSGYRIGAGFTGLPFVAINLELMHLEHKKISGSGVTVTPGKPHELNLFGIFVSVPLSL